MLIQHHKFYRTSNNLVWCYQHLYLRFAYTNKLGNRPIQQSLYTWHSHQIGLDHYSTTRRQNQPQKAANDTDQRVLLATKCLKDNDIFTRFIYPNQCMMFYSFNQSARRCVTRSCVMHQLKLTVMQVYSNVSNYLTLYLWFRLLSPLILYR